MKGIRSFTNQTFFDNLQYRDQLGNTGFRKKVLEEVVNMFGIKTSAASTHYNYSLKLYRTTHPDMIAGLGREVDEHNSELTETE